MLTSWLTKNGTYYKSCDFTAWLAHSSVIDHQDECDEKSGHFLSSQESKRKKAYFMVQQILILTYTGVGYTYIYGSNTFAQLLEVYRVNRLDCMYAGVYFTCHILLWQNVVSSLHSLDKVQNHVIRLQVRHNALKL